MTFEEMQAIVEGMLESQQQFQKNMEQEMNLFLARQRELQESDLRRQSELDRVSQQIQGLTGQIQDLAGQVQGLTGQIQGLTLIAESLVTNAQVSDRIQEDHEQRIRDLEQE